MGANVIEQATVEEIQTTKAPSTTSSTTTAPIPTSATGDVSNNQRVEEPLSSPYFPDIPDLVAQGAIEDTSKNYDASAESLQSTILQEYDEEDIADSNPFIIRDYPPPNDVPLKMTSQPSGIPRLPPRRKQNRLDPRCSTYQ